jgi:hypothetical protein
MKNDTTEERKVTRTENHFGGKHRTIHFNDGTTCNVYNDGYRSASDSVDRSKLSLTNNTMNNTTVKTRRKANVTEAVPSADVVKTVKAVKAPKVASAAAAAKTEVLAKIAEFRKNPGLTPLTVKEVVKIIGSSHRQVYVFISEHGKPAGTSSAHGRGQKAKLFTFDKAE